MTTYIEWSLLASPLGGQFRKGRFDCDVFVVFCWFNLNWFKSKVQEKRGQYVNIPF